jgi:glycine cleavage system protein P-like pyridoxal-binding family
MKLNAAAEMLPLSWSEWGSVHPFVPKGQALGYQQLIEELEKILLRLQVSQELHFSQIQELRVNMQD